MDGPDGQRHGGDHAGRPGDINDGLSGLIASSSGDASWLPAFSITETDTDQTVSAGGVAHFDVKAQWRRGVTGWAGDASDV